MTNPWAALRYTAISDKTSEDNVEFYTFTAAVCGLLKSCVREQ